MSIFDNPYYHLSVKEQLQVLADRYPEKVMLEIEKILEPIPSVTIITVNDFMLTVSTMTGCRSVPLESLQDTD